MPVKYDAVGDMLIDATPICSVSNIDGKNVYTVEYANDGVVLKDMYLLFDSEGKPISEANEYLIHIKSCSPSTDLASTAKGLMHFFSYCEQEGIAWDSTPRVQSNRPLYRFRDYLQSLHDTFDGTGKKRLIASSTANSYKGIAAAFVKFWLERGHHFTHPPCRYYETKIDTTGILAHVRRHIRVSTNDLKITAHDTNTDSKLPNHMRPLLKPEKDALLQAIRSGYGLENRRGKLGKVKFQTAFKMLVLLSLTTGCRNKECATFSSALVTLPKANTNEATVSIQISPSVGCHTKNGKSRDIAVPNALMRQLFAYKNSAEYQERLKSYREKNAQNPFALRYPPMFLKKDGSIYSSGYLNARWGELRRMINDMNPDLGFEHKFHNLRPTYGTDLTVAFLTIKYPKDHPEHPNEYRFSRNQVEQLVQARLGHTDPSTTRLYVQFLEEQNLVRGADMAYEKHLNELLGAIDETSVDSELLELLKD